MLEQHRRDVALGQPGALQCPHQEDVRIGAAGDCDPLALELRDRRDRGVLAGDERRPLGPRIDVDRLDRIAVDLAHEGGGAGGRAEIDRVGAEEFQRLVRAERLHPADLDAVLGEFLLEQALILEHHRDRVVGRPVDADFARLVGGVGADTRQQAGRKRGGEDRTTRE